MATRITEIKTIDIERPCMETSVCLNWLANPCGRDFFVFQKVQVEYLETEENERYKNFVSDLETAIGNNELYGKSAFKTMILGASNILSSKMDGIKSLLSSPDVLILMNNDTWQTEGCKWQRVIVKSGTFKILETNQNRTSFEFLIEFPSTNIQTK